MFGQPDDAEQLAVKDWLVEKADPGHAPRPQRRCRWRLTVTKEWGCADSSRGGQIPPLRAESVAHQVRRAHLQRVLPRSPLSQPAAAVCRPRALSRHIIHHSGHAHLIDRPSGKQGRRVSAAM